MSYSYGTITNLYENVTTFILPPPADNDTKEYEEKVKELLSKNVLRTEHRNNKIEVIVVKN